MAIKNNGEMLKNYIVKLETIILQININIFLSNIFQHLPNVYRNEIVCNFE